MSKVKVKGLDAALQNIRKIFDDVKTSDRVLSEMGSFVVERVRAETRAGNSIPNGSKFPSLAESTVEARRGARELGITDPIFFRSPEFANNTMTGQLLESLMYKIDGDVLSIEVPPTPRFDGEETNKDVADNLAELGREFIGVNEKMRTRLKRIVLDEFRRRVKK